MTKKLLNRFTDIAERLDWTVDKCDNGDLEISQYSPAGEDFAFTIDTDKCDTLLDISDKIQDYWENYDPDYEASLWIGDDGHGKNGAPYHISTLIKDKEDIEQMIEDLWREVYGEYVHDEDKRIKNNVLS